MSREEWAAWVGPEVEGRLLGVPTLCVAEPVSTDVIVAYPHVLFGTGFLVAHGYDLPAQVIDRVMVTLEVTPAMVTTIPKDLLERAHILCRIHAGTGVLKLKPSDTIRLDVAELHVLTVTRYQMQETRPHDYEVDMPVAYREGTDV